MRVRLTWTDDNYGESEHRVYRDTAPLDPQNLPAPIATVGDGVTTWDDENVVDQTTYYYLVSAVVNGVEYKSVEHEHFVDSGAAVGVYAGAVLADNPVFYWTFDGSSVATDVSGNGNDGSVVSPNFTTNPTAANNGHGDDLALAFDGQTYINIKNLGGQIGTDSFTLEFTYPVVPDSTSGSCRLGFHDGAGSNFLNFWDPTTNNQWNLPDGSNGEPGNRLTAGEYTHVVIVYDRADQVLRLYVDGAEIVDSDYPLATSLPAVPSDMQFTVGMEWDGTTPSDFTTTGQIDSISLYKGALSPQQVLAHYEASLGL